MSLAIDGTNGIDFNLDNAKIKLGASDDLQIYHDGSNSYIQDSGTGNLILQATDFQVKGYNTGEVSIESAENGAVNLYHNNSKKFETHSAGCKVSAGNLYLDRDNAKLVLGASDDLQIYHDGTSSRIHNLTGNLTIKSDNILGLYTYTGTEAMAKFNANGAVELHYDNSKKFETTSSGVLVSGNVDAGTGNFLTDDNGKYFAGTGGDLEIYHNGTDSYVENGTGDLYLKSTGDDVIIQAADDIFIKPQAGDSGIEVIGDGAVKLFYDGNKKFETDADGVQVTGNLQAHAGDGLTDSDWTSHDWHVLHTNAGNKVAAVVEHSNNSQPYGMIIDFSDDSPDDNTFYFLSCTDNTTQRLKIYSDGDVWNHDNSYTGSDETLKENIVDATSKLEDLKKLKVRNFNWKADYFPEKSKTKQIGFIAQEVEQVFPSLVSEHDIAPGAGKDDDHTPVMKKAIKQAWAPILVKALQEAVAKIETLETKVAALEAK